MKKERWFLKDGDKLTEMSVGQLLAYTSSNISLKITQQDLRKEVHKIVEFTK
jgi:hypothetical protein